MEKRELGIIFIGLFLIVAVALMLDGFGFQLTGNAINEVPNGNCYFPATTTNHETPHNSLMYVDGGTYYEDRFLCYDGVWRIPEHNDNWVKEMNAGIMEVVENPNYAGWQVINDADGIKRWACEEGYTIDRDWSSYYYCVGGDFAVSPPFSAKGSTIRSNQIQLEIKSHASEDLTLREAWLEFKNPSSATCDVEIVENSLIAGSTKILSFESCNLVRGESINADLYINYTRLGTSLVLTSSGTLSGKVDGGLVSSYSFDDETLTDAGSNYDLTSNKELTFVNGILGKAISLGEGATREIYSDALSEVAFNEYAISFWINVPESAQDQTSALFYKRSETDWTKTNFLVYLSQGALGVGHNSVDGSGSIFDTGVQIGTGWKHVVAQYNGNELQIYVNNQLKLSESAGAPVTDGTQTLHVGDSQFEDEVMVFQGMLDEINIYSAALTEEEIDELYSVGDTCTDTDGGDNIFVRGTVREGEVSSNFIDTCNGPNQVMEFFCNENNIARYKIQECYEGCSAGACQKLSCEAYDFNCDGVTNETDSDLFHGMYMNLLQQNRNLNQTDIDSQTCQKFKDYLTTYVGVGNKIALGHNTFIIRNVLECSPENKKLPPCGNYGDVDGDGYVTQVDYELVGQMAARNIPINLDTADLNGDENVTIADWVLMGRYIEGLDSTFPVCTKTSPCGNYGDVNGDGYVNIDDVTLAREYYLGNQDLTTEQFERLDLDGNEEISFSELNELIGYVGGARESLSACDQPTPPVEPGQGRGCLPSRANGPKIQARTRLMRDGKLQFCDPQDLEYKDTISNGEDCTNDYECQSNLCLDGECSSISEEIKRQGNLINQIWCYVKDFFGGEDYDTCMLQFEEPESPESYCEGNDCILYEGETLVVGEYDFVINVISQDYAILEINEFNTGQMNENTPQYFSEEKVGISINEINFRSQVGSFNFVNFSYFDFKDSKHIPGNSGSRNCVKSDADVNGDWKINMSEALRFVQLYTVGDYHCNDSASWKGFAPGVGNKNCSPHNADLNRDWKINEIEMRLFAFIWQHGEDYSCLTADKTSPCGNYGDVDGDGYVTDSDLELLSLMITGSITQNMRGDVMGDGILDVGDSIKMGRYIEGLDSTFPVCEKCSDYEQGSWEYCGCMYPGKGLESREVCTCVFGDENNETKIGDCMNTLRVLKQVQEGEPYTYFNVLGNYRVKIVSGNVGVGQEHNVTLVVLDKDDNRMEFTLKEGEYAELEPEEIYLRVNSINTLSHPDYPNDPIISWIGVGTELCDLGPDERCTHSVEYLYCDTPYCV